MQTTELAPTSEATEILVKILDSNYAKAKLEHVSTNTSKMNSEERIKFLSILNEFDYLFDGTIVEWDTYHIDLESNPEAKLVNSKYYPVPSIKTETFRK